MTQMYKSEEEKVTEILFHDDDVRHDIIHRHLVRIMLLCRLLSHRSSENLIGKSDMETIERIDVSDEQYDKLLDFLKERLPRHPSLQLLDCLRCTPAGGNIPSLPIKRTIIWVTPTSQFASYVVNEIQTMSLLKEPLQPFFWPVHHSNSALGHTGYLYRVCNIFTSVYTKLILVWPDTCNDYDDNNVDESPNRYNQYMINAIKGSLSQWRSSVNLTLVYTDVLTSAGVDGRVSLYKTAALPSTGSEDNMIGELRKEEEKRSDTWTTCNDTKREFTFYYQMMWLGRLAIEIENETSNSGSSELLQLLEWDVKETTLTPYQSNVLSQNLPHWTNGELLKYIVNTRLWYKDETCLLGVVPGPIIREGLGRIPPSFFTSIPQFPDRCMFSIEENNDRLPEVIRCSPLPKIVTCGIVPAHLITPTFYRLAVEACCRFTVECVILYK